MSVFAHCRTYLQNKCLYDLLNKFLYDLLNKCLCDLLNNLVALDIKGVFAAKLRPVKTLNNSQAGLIKS